MRRFTSFALLDRKDGSQAIAGVRNLANQKRIRLYLVSG